VPPPLAVRANLPEPAPLDVRLTAVRAPSAVTTPDLFTLNCDVPPTRKRIRKEPAALAVSVTSVSKPSKVTPALFHVAVVATGLAAALIVPSVKVFAPRKLWAAIVTNPRLEVDAEGILNVWVVPLEEILKSAPVVPVANVCVVPVRPLSEVIPVAGGLAHVPSPLQNVLDEAAVPLFKFATGKFPVTSVLSETDAKLGAPPAFPCNTVVVVPRLPKVETAVVFPPITS